MLYLIVRFLAISIFKLAFRLQAFGRDKIPPAGGFILASNHASYLDPPLLGAACPRVLHYLAKEELFKNGLFGRFIKGLNSLPVKSQRGRIRSLRRAVKGLREGQALTIFPEGGRSADGSLVRPLWGVGFLAAKASVPIVPAFIDGSSRALPVHSKFILPFKIRVYFGRPFYPAEIKEDLKGKDFYQAIAARTMAEIVRLMKWEKAKIYKQRSG